jgi:hypothetical protein
MENKPKRPVSVWIAQILLSLACLWVSALMVWAAIFMFRGGGTITIIIPILFLLAFPAFFFFGVFGMARRRRWGRWLGVAGLSLLFLSALGGQVVGPDGPLHYYAYKNAAEFAGGLMGSLVMFGLLLWLILRLALSEHVTNFFSPPIATTFDEPPPPPTFAD